MAPPHRIRLRKGSDGRCPMCGLPWILHKWSDTLKDYYCIRVVPRRAQ